MQNIIHPDDMFLLKEELWPDVVFYDKQVEVIESTFWNDVTVVPAANKMGKDFVCGFIVPAAFLICIFKKATCRIVTTSVAEHHLKVLWGEVGRFLTTAKEPLVYDPKKAPHAPLVVNYQEIRRVEEAEAKNPLNYAVGRVSAKGEGMAGHHADFTLVIGDESSGLDNEIKKQVQGWAKQELWIGNPNDCQNFWRKDIEAVDDLVAA